MGHKIYPYLLRQLIDNPGQPGVGYGYNLKSRWPEALFFRGSSRGLVFGGAELASIKHDDWISVLRP